MNLHVKTTNVRRFQYEFVFHCNKKPVTKFLLLLAVPFFCFFCINDFFGFTSFSLNKIIMEKISSDGRVETMCQTVAVFLMVFVIFYIFYSNNFFMRRSMKELGIYALLGYRKLDMLRILTFENLFICMGGLIIGIFAGSLLHKGVTAGIITLLGLKIDSSGISFINLNAVKFNLVFVIVVLFTLMLSNARLLWKSTLLDLVRIEKRVEKPIRSHTVTAVISIFFLVLGYALALDMRRGSAIEYRVSDVQQRECSLRTLESTLDESEYQFYESTIIKTTAVSDRLPLEYNIGDNKGRIPGFECMSRKDYETLIMMQEKKNISLPLIDLCKIHRQFYYLRKQ